MNFSYLRSLLDFLLLFFILGLLLIQSCIINFLIVFTLNVSWCIVVIRLDLSLLATHNLIQLTRLQMNSVTLDVAFIMLLITTKNVIGNLITTSTYTKLFAHLILIFTPYLLSILVSTMITFMTSTSRR